MRKLYLAAFAYLLVGVASGLYYRELTKLTGWPEGQPTQLGVAHTHLLTLGFIVLLIVLVLEKVFTLSRSRLFPWFFWVYNAGVDPHLGDARAARIAHGARHRSRRRRSQGSPARATCCSPRGSSCCCWRCASRCSLHEPRERTPRNRARCQRSHPAA